MQNQDKKSCPKKKLPNQDQMERVVVILGSPQLARTVPNRLAKRQSRWNRGDRGAYAPPSQDIFTLFQSWDRGEGQIMPTLLLIPPNFQPFRRPWSEVFVAHPRIIVLRHGTAALSIRFNFTFSTHDTRHNGLGSIITLKRRVQSSS